MKKMKKFEAFAAAVKAFGPWRTWSRGQHLAYGLARGVPYSTMERTANDNPHMCWVYDQLVKMGVIEDIPYAQFDRWKAQHAEIDALIVWVHKVPRRRVARPEAIEAAQ